MADEASTPAAEVVRGALDAGNENAWEGEAVAAYFRPTAPIHPFPEWPGPSAYVGRDGIRALIAEWTSNFDDFGWKPVRMMEVGERVIALGRIGGRSKHGLAVQGPIAGIFRIEAGLIAEAWFYNSWDEALEAAEGGDRA